MTTGPETADVVIIGAGASGAATAWALSGDGLKIVCLEQGDWVDQSSSPSLDNGWEIALQTVFHPNPHSRAGARDYPVTDDATPIKPALFNAVGGGTIRWGGHFPRLHPSDFRVHTLDGVADDWPVSYPELEPYFDLNDRMMGVAGLAGDPANPPRAARPTARRRRRRRRRRCRHRRRRPCSISSRPTAAAQAKIRPRWSPSCRR